MTERETAARGGARVPPAPAAQPVGRSLRIAAWSAIGAGVAGLAGLLSTLPWPELFGLDAVPNNAIVFDPRLFGVLVGHYGILALGGVLGLLAGVMFSLVLRRRRLAAAAALLVAAGSGVMGYAAGRRAVDVALNDGRSTLELAALVWGGGGMLLAGTVVLTLALRRDTGMGFLVLGLSSPVLVAVGVATFAILGEGRFPMIWGLTFPPPPDYLLAIWFIVLGWLARTGQLQLVVVADPAARARGVVGSDGGGQHG